MALFCGPLHKELDHRLVDQTETMFGYILRHTFYRPRDLMVMGRAIANVPAALRTHRRLKHEVDKVGTALVRQLMTEMRPFFPLPLLNVLLTSVTTNALDTTALNQSLQDYLAKAKQTNGLSLEGEYAHPFCVLHKIGMLGGIETVFDSGEKTIQRFVKPDEVFVKNHVHLPPTEGFYLVHPALDNLIHEKRGREYIRAFHRSNIVGGDLLWEEPRESLFVLQGDLCDFSVVMETDLYRPLAEKLEE